MFSQNDDWNIKVYSGIPKRELDRFKKFGYIPNKDRNKYYKGICHKKGNFVKLVNYYDPKLTNDEWKKYQVSTSFWNLPKNVCDSLVNSWLELDVIPKGSAIVKYRDYNPDNLKTREEYWSFK